MSPPLYFRHNFSWFSSIISDTLTWRRTDFWWCTTCVWWEPWPQYKSSLTPCFWGSYILAPIKWSSHLRFVLISAAFLRLKYVYIWMCPHWDMINSEARSSYLSIKWIYLVLDFIDSEIKMMGAGRGGGGIENISIANLNEFTFYMHFLLLVQFFICNFL